MDFRNYKVDVTLKWLVVNRIDVITFTVIVLLGLSPIKILGT